MSTCVGTCGHYIIITMVTGECQWSDRPLIKEMMTGCRSLPSHEVRLHHHPHIPQWADWNGSGQFEWSEVL